jgi:tRNA synthetases class I (E and Q), catalytic domain
MVRVRFAPSPTGSLHVGNALVAVANRAFADEHGGVLLLRIDDTDLERSTPEDERAILDELTWLGLRWDEGPVRQSDRAEAHRAAADRLLASGRAFAEDGAIRFDAERRPTLLRADGRPTYHLASVVDDIDLGVTHVIRGKDHAANTALHMVLAEALGAQPPEYRHIGLVVDADGRKLSKRREGATLADLRGRGIPGEAVRSYLAELDHPRGDVHLDLQRLQRLSIDAIAGMPDAELAERAGAPRELVPALRGARNLNEAQRIARSVLEPERVELPSEVHPTLERFRELRERAGERVDEQEARGLVRELKAVGGDLRAVRLALTGRDRGPELWAVVFALPRNKALQRVDAAMTP